MPQPAGSSRRRLAPPEFGQRLEARGHRGLLQVAPAPSGSPGSELLPGKEIDVVLLCARLDTDATLVLSGTVTPVPHSLDIVLGGRVAGAQAMTVPAVLAPGGGWSARIDLADPDVEGRAARTALETDPEAIIVSSFSKYFGMTGWRLGWLVLPEELLDAADNLAVNFFLCASTPTQMAALACFTPEALASCEARRVELGVRRGIVLDGLRRIGLPVPVEPDGAFYVYFDVSGTGLDSTTFCTRALEEAHVALTPGVDFGPAMADTHVRLSYAASRAELAEGMRRLEGFVRPLG